MRHPERNAHHRHDENRIEQGTTYFQFQQDSTQQDTANGNHRGGSPGTQSCNRRIIDDDDTTILQSDESDKQTDTH